MNINEDHKVSLIEMFAGIDFKVKFEISLKKYINAHI